MNDFLNEHTDASPKLSRRSLMMGLGAGLAVAGAASLISAAPAAAQSVPAFVSNGKKVRVGLGLNYGPFNQPWRRGCWRICQTVLDNGGEMVTVRGEPSKQSEQDSARQLLDRGIDVLVLGIYSQESETAYIVEDAHRRGVKTVGFMVPVKDSPSVIEDTWATGTATGYWLQNRLGRQGTIVQTAEDRGFYTPFDMEVDQLELMTRYESRMKMLPFMTGSTSTSDQISKGRENILSLLQANPSDDSLHAIASWWWPLTVGASQALTQMNRKAIVTNHYFSEQLLSEMVSPDSPIEFSTDVPYHTAGDRIAEIALMLGQGQDVPNHIFHVPVTAIEKHQAADALAELKEMDRQAIELLKNYGG